MLVMMAVGAGVGTSEKGNRKHKGGVVGSCGERREGEEKEKEAMI